jgi:glycosyltransferase involved in cell wall biosynthesis
MVKRLHVLLVSHRFASYAPGGTEGFTEDLARGLVERGHRVTWVAAPRDTDPELVRTAGVERLSPSRAADSNYPSGWRGHEERAAEEMNAMLTNRPRVDVVHVTHSAGIGLQFLLCERLRDVPVVATFTDYTPLCPDYQIVERITGSVCSSGAAPETCARCCEPRRMAPADIASWRASNIAMINERISRVWFQTPWQAAVYKAWGVDVQVASTSASYAIPRGWSSLSGKSHQRVIFLGRASREKGLGLMLEAVSSSRDLHLDIVTLADDARLERQLRAKAALLPTVRWMPPVPRQELGRLLRGYAALIIPSQWPENHPVVLDYALAVGTTVMCSAVPSLGHLRGPQIHHVQDYAHPGAWASEIQRFLASPRKQPVNRVLEYSERHERFVDGVCAHYQDLVGS